MVAVFLPRVPDGVFSFHQLGIVSIAAGRIGFLLLVCLFVGTGVAYQPLLLVGGLLSLALFLVSVYRPLGGLLALVVVTGLASGLPRGELVPALRPNEIVLAIVILAVLVRVLSGRDPFRITALDGAFALLLIFGSVVPFATAVYRGGTLEQQDLVRLVGPIQYYFLFRLAISVDWSGKASEVVLRVFLLTGAAVGIIAILQASNILGVRDLLSAVIETPQIARAGVVGRATSTLGGWNDLGVYMTLLLLTGLVSVAASKPPLGRLLMSMILTVGFVALLLSGSLAAASGLIVGIGMLLLMRRASFHKVVLLVTAVAVVLGLLTLTVGPVREVGGVVASRVNVQWNAETGVVPNSLRTRAEVWELIGADVTRDVSSFVFGIGPSPAYVVTNDGDAQVARYFASTAKRVQVASEEGQYSMLMLRGGILALGAHLLLVLMLLRGTAKGLSSSDEQVQRFSVIATIGLVVFSVMSITNAFFSYAGSSDMLWILIGMSVALQWRWREGQRSPVVEAGLAS